MHPALEQLLKVLNLEIKDGYPNKAVIGGLPKMLAFWEANARRGNLDANFIQSVKDQINAYPGQDHAQRTATVAALIGMARAAGPAPKASPVQSTPPRAPQPPPSQPPAPRHAPAPQARSPQAAPTPQPSQPRAPGGESAQRTTPPEVVSQQPSAPQYSAPSSTAPTAAPLFSAPDAPSSTATAPADAAASLPAGANEPARQPAPAAQPPKAAQTARGGQQPAQKTARGGKKSGQPQQAQRPRRDFVDTSEEPLDPRPRRAASPRPLRAETPLDPNAGLNAPLTVLHGVGPETAADYARLGINTLRDLLLYFPRRYDDYSRMKTINRLELGEEVTVIGTVIDAHEIPMRNRGGKMLKAVISDTTAELEITFFNQPYLAKKLVPGRQIVVSGRVSEYLGRLSMTPSEHEDLDRELLSTGRIVPVYRKNADLKARGIRKLTKQVVQYWAPKQPDILPADIIKRAGLLTYAEALAQIHFPDSQEKLAAARGRLAFDELLLLQLGVQRQRQAWQSAAGRPLAVDDAAHAAFIASLPYPLTGAQARAVADIRADMGRPMPMNRLLQGDVGAGKTAVAAAGMALAVQAGAQAAIMAPTSILAEQHYKTLSQLLGTVLGDPGALRLLQGATPASEKAAIYAGLQSGEIKAVVGTHAIIEDPLVFSNLGLVVVDEQHRFGVAQRAALRAKGANPHLLVMTATPIPRSLALTVFGDLDLSVLDEMPPGRQAIQTYLLKAPERERGYAFIRSQLVKGRQAFIIFPLVEESDKIEAKAAVAEHARLQREVFEDFKLGLLHGRMKPDEKDAVMTAFRAGEFDVLVSTSVVEVGVDVPNATIMLIEGANRFGLAQLHQFRGRVGRGEHASFCLLISDSANLRPDDRLQALLESQDGFYLAEKDLELRGPGDFLGARQSGFSSLQMAHLTDLGGIDKARREAAALFEKDPQLEAPEHAALAARLAQFWSPEAADAS